MFDGVALSNLIDGEGTLPDIDLPYERLELLTLSASFSFHLGPEFPCGLPSSVTLTVHVESPSPSVDAFVVVPFGLLIETKPDTFFPAEKAGLSGAEKAGLSGTAVRGERTAAQMAADGGTLENAIPSHRLLAAREAKFLRRIESEIRLGDKLGEPYMVSVDIRAPFLRTRAGGVPDSIEFDVITKSFVGETKSSGLTLGKGLRVKVENVLRYAQETDRIAVFEFRLGYSQETYAFLATRSSEMGGIPYWILGPAF